MTSASPATAIATISSMLCVLVGLPVTLYALGPPAHHGAAAEAEAAAPVVDHHGSSASDKLVGADFCRGPPPPLVRSCTLTRYGGKEGAKNPYGAWTLCSEILNRDSHVFSVGIGSDVSFDAAVIKRHGARVSCFDPTITREAFERIIKRNKLSAAQRSLATFYPFGLSESDDVLAFYHHNSSKIASLVSTTGLPGYLKQPWLRAPVLRVQTLQFIANVSRIDVLKMDVEGAEWMMFRRRNKSLRAWLRCSPPRQIAIEFHDRMFRLGKVQREQVVKLLDQCGFTLRHQSLPSKEQNLFVRDRVATAQC
jgi:FkbM family methyltransferase